MLNRILSMLAGSWALKKRFYADYGVTDYANRIEPVCAYLVTKRITETKELPKRCHKPFEVSIAILTCISYIELVQWLNNADHFQLLLAKHDDLMSEQSAVAETTDESIDETDVENSSWSVYVADFVKRNARVLRRDVFAAVHPFYVEQSRAANFNLFAEIANDDDLGFIEGEVDDAVHDLEVLGLYAGADMSM